MLTLKDDKFEYIIFSPNHRVLSRSKLCISIKGTTFHPASQVRNLGVIQDSSLTMEKQINAVTSSCYHGIRRISRIRRFITPEACRSLVKAWVTSRLDYFNVLYYLFIYLFIYLQYLKRLYIWPKPFLHAGLYNKQKTKITRGAECHQRFEAVSAHRLTSCTAEPKTNVLDYTLQK